MAEKIKELRKEKGLTQAELSQISHVPRICIARYEAGEHQPGMGNAQKLAAALGVTVDELIGKEDAS
jgi:transcriptional regulator with XRE-family HTH domain